MKTLVGVALRGWPGQICDLSNIFFFCFLFLRSSSRAQVAYLDRSERSIRHNACFRPRMCLLGSRQYPTTFRGSNPPKKTSPKGAGIGTSQPNRRSSKNSHISVTNGDFGVKFHRQIDYRGHSRKNAKFGLMGSWRGHVTYFWNFGTPPYLGKGWS